MARQDAVRGEDGHAREHSLCQDPLGELGRLVNLCSRQSVAEGRTTGSGYLYGQAVRLLRSLEGARQRESQRYRWYIRQ